MYFRYDNVLHVHVSGPAFVSSVHLQLSHGKNCQLQNARVNEKVLPPQKNITSAQLVHWYSSFVKWHFLLWHCNNLALKPRIGLEKCT